MIRPQLALAAGLFCLIFSCSCTSPASDETLANSIKASLYSDQTTKAENITVTVKGNEVTLTGDVSTSDAALEAMKIANGTAGVKSVTDHLTINGQSAATQLPNAGSVPNTTPATATSSPPPPPPPQPAEITIPAGEQVSVRTIDTIDSGVNQQGQVFRGTLSSPLVTHGHIIVPTGAPATLLLAEVQSAGRVAGKASLEIRLSTIRFRGHTYKVDSSVFSEEGGSRGKQTAVRTGIGAAAGAVIGALAGGGKGAAIGSAAGGGAGLGSDLFTKGPRVRVPSESVLTFELEAPLTVQR